MRIMLVEFLLSNDDKLHGIRTHWHFIYVGGGGAAAAYMFSVLLWLLR